MDLMMDIISDELVLKGHTAQVFDCAWNPSAPILASVSDELRFWNISDGTGESRPQGDLIKVTEPLSDEKRVTALEWNDAGTLLATTSCDGHTRIWSTSGDLKSTLSGAKTLFALRWNENNTSLLTGAHDGTATVWDVDTSEVKQQFDLISFRKYSMVDVDWRNDDSFAICSGRFSIRIYKIGETHPISTFGNENRAYVNCIRWDPTGLVLASCSNDCRVKIWRVEEDRYIRTLGEHKKDVNLIRWCPTGRILASGSEDATVKLWDVEQGKSLYTLHEHWASVNNLAFSPNGEYLAGGAEDQIHIWSVKEGKLIKSYLSETSGVSGVCWNKEGDKIAAGFADSTVRVLNFRK